MTIDELLDEAAKVGGWRVWGVARIRSESGYCPIVAVARGRGFKGDNWEWWKAAAVLELPVEDARQVVIGTDYEWGELRGEIETRLGVENLHKGA